jgi:hypothetical protein
MITFEIQCAVKAGQQIAGKQGVRAGADYMAANGVPMKLALAALVFYMRK